MLKRFFSFISNRITGISTPFGGVSWKSSGKIIQDVTRFDGCIYLTSKCNKDFLQFLDDNDRKIVFVDVCIDASVSIQEQMEIAEKEALNFQAACISGSMFTIPNKENRLVSMVFYLKEDHILNHSHGGTGVDTISLNGYFEISCSLYGGPSMVYYLKEIDAPFEEKIAMLNQ
jgi:hypothetical protein